MFELDPGPIVPETLPLRPRVVTPGTFLGLAGEVSTVLSQAETGVGVAAGQLAPYANVDIDPEYGNAAAEAIAGLDALDRPADTAEYATYEPLLDEIDGGVSAQQRELPGPDEPEPDLGLSRVIEPEPAPTPEERAGWEDQFGNEQQTPTPGP